jgi:hypothetical protein
MCHSGPNVRNTMSLLQIKQLSSSHCVDSSSNKVSFPVTRSTCVWMPNITSPLTKLQILGGNQYSLLIDMTTFHLLVVVAVVRRGLVFITWHWRDTEFTGWRRMWIVTKGGGVVLQHVSWAGWDPLLQNSLWECFTCLRVSVTHGTSEISVSVFRKKNSFLGV